MAPDKAVTLEEIYDHVKREVPRYVKENLPDRSTPQVPILVNNTGTFYLRR
jgi:hypothetical protein